MSLPTSGFEQEAAPLSGVPFRADVELLPIENPDRVGAPQWVADLAICEINPRGFTSPNGAGDGHGSGTFRSAAARMPYLAETGANAVWLAGYQEATDHFYGVWSAYAVRRFDSFDPSLGDADDFRYLVNAAHAAGVRVLLEVISHGVLRDSPLVGEYPEWFLPHGSWGMADFDYRNAEFRTWWIDLWTTYVTSYGVDGFRVDLGLGDATLWDEIANRCAAAGHPIVILCERERYHLAQNDWPALSPDIAAEWHGTGDRFRTQQLSCHDEGWSALPGNHYRVRGSRAWFGYGAAFSHRIPLWFAGEEFDAEQVNLPAVRRGLFGAGGPGGWLYGCQLPWDQLGDPARAAFHADVSRMFAIRRAHRDLLNCDRWRNEMLALTSAPDAPLVPYARVRRGEKVIVVAGNDTAHPLDVRLALPLDGVGFDRTGRYRVRDLWLGGDRFLTGDEIAAGFLATIGPDKSPLGGVAIFEIVPAGSEPRSIDTQGEKR
jgi:hypothetical protein